MKTIIRALHLSALALVLAGCGGGGSADEPVTTGVHGPNCAASSAPCR